MKKQYIFSLLIIIMLYMIYLVLSYKYTEYKILRYTQSIQQINIEYIQRINKSQEILENKNTKAYKNKILKAEQGLKNPGEQVVFYISEQDYNSYTKDEETDASSQVLPQNLLDEKSLISTMNIYQKWVYLLFDKDIR